MAMPGTTRFATAVHILTLLASEGERAVTSDYVAGSVNTNPVVIRRLLRMLAEAGLVISAPGATGGSHLARSPRRITLFDVYSAVESGSLFGQHSQPPNRKCPVGSQIVDLLAAPLEAAEEAAEKSLRKTTIADLLQRLERRKN
jgi:Rrf2 family protein